MNIAQWLNETFANFDLTVYQWFQTHFHDTTLEKLFDVLFSAITFLGEKALPLMIIAFILMLFKKTRKAGTAMLGGIIIGALFTNVALKPFVARPRPYTHTNMPFYRWWIDAGSHLESEFSFPSGHTTSAMSAMTGLFMVTDKRISWTAFLFAILMGMSRIFFFVHYPSDILGGLVVGLVSGIIAGVIVNLIYKNQKNKLFGFYTNFSFSKKQ